MRTKSLVAAFTGHRETDFGPPETKAAKTASARSSLWPETARPVLALENARNLRAIRETPGNLGSRRMRGGAGRTRTGNQTVISSMLQPQQPASGAHERGIDDGGRKDWHSTAN